MRFTTTLKVSTLSILIAVAAPATATTLTDAMIQAYQTNPALRVSRSGLRATDEGVRQAKAGLEPTISANLSVDRNESKKPTITSSPTTSASATVTASYPIYAGGTVLNGIEQARFTVLANRQSLVSTEQSVLLDAVTSFMDVRRDQRNVELSQNSVRVLNEEVRAANERFEVGEVTRTDVAQAESRQAASESTLQSSRAALKRSIDFYIATVGSAPKNLRLPPASPQLPKTANAAEAIAISRHPSILQQQFAVQAAEKALEIAYGNKLPVVSAAILARRSNNNAAIDVQDKLTEGVFSFDVDQIIYQGDRLNSIERQALALLDQEKASLQLTGVQVRQNVQSQFATWYASKVSIQARRKQVRAAKIAFDGASEEAKLGARTTLDVLNSEQDLLQAQTDLVSAIRDEYVNSYGVLAAMGLMTVAHLNLGIPSYNPDVNYTAVNGPRKFGLKRSKLFDKIKKLSGN